MSARLVMPGDDFDPWVATRQVGGVPVEHQTVA
jgi:hypothetical protein